MTCLRRHPDVELFSGKGGDNLAATFSPELVDSVIYVIDVSGGTKFHAKAVPALLDRIFSSSTRWIWRRTSRRSVSHGSRYRRMRGDLPFAFTNILSGEGLDAVVARTSSAYRSVERDAHNRAGFNKTTKKDWFAKTYGSETKHF